MKVAMLKEVILDKAATYALLNIALEEGLIEEDNYRTDGFLSSPRIRKPPDWLKRQLLEQAVLTPKFKTFTFLPKAGLYGRLIEEGLLEVIPVPEEVNTIFEKIPSDVISGMLAGLGIEIPQDEYISRILSAREALQEANEFERKHGKPLPSAWTHLASSIARFASGERFDLQGVPDGYTKEDVEMEKRHSQIFERVRPITDCLAEYSNMLSASKKEQNIIKTPFHEPSEQNVDNNLFTTKSTASREVALFRLVATRLGKLTYRTTLNESLSLSEESATKSLREHIPLWLKSISEQDIQAANLIQAEIMSASRAMESVSRWDIGSQILGFFSIPVSLLEFFLNLPPIPGIALELISRGIDADNEIIEESVQWISYGNFTKTIK